MSEHEHQHGNGGQATEEQRPHRLTELAEKMTELLKEESDVRAVVFLESEGWAGVHAHGYDSDVDATLAIVGHVRDLFRQMGKEVLFLPVEALAGIEVAVGAEPGPSSGQDFGGTITGGGNAA